jgi:hypothetical protein
MTRPPAAGENVEEATLRNVEACFRDGASLRNAFVRPNEVWMATRTAADVFFKAPLDAAGKVFTSGAGGDPAHRQFPGAPADGARSVVRALDRRIRRPLDVVVRTCTCAGAVEVAIST